MTPTPTRAKPSPFARLASLLGLSHCLLCAARCDHSHGFCVRCLNALPTVAGACECCALPLTQAAARCGRCQRKPPAFTHTYALFRYATPIDRLVVALKYRQELHLARSLGNYMAQALAHVPRPDAIVPVPLHASRLRERGYNQSLELARPIAQALTIPLEFRAAQRIRATPSQTELSYAARARNVRNAFASTGAFAQKHVAIVDDVMTSGHTAHAFAQCLLAAGARQVDVWVLARA